MIEKYNLAISYTWEYDEDFVGLIEQVFHEFGLTTYIIREHNIAEVTENLHNKKLAFDCYLDRASDADDRFIPMAKILTRRNVRIFNPYKLVAHAIDKATMHLEFITAGLNTPYSIIIPPVNEKYDIFISLDDLEKLGRPFIIKPCNTTGGGLGVVTGAETLREVLKERRRYSDDKYLIQEKVIPQSVDDHRAWFRCFWAFGKPICAWWDDLTHRYDILTEEQTEEFCLQKLHSITKKIGHLTDLDFVSTEIVLETNGKFVVVDYVNDQCDMRFRSKHFDGVPDELVRQIVMNMMKEVKKSLILRSKS